MQDFKTSAGGVAVQLTNRKQIIGAWSTSCLPRAMSVICSATLRWILSVYKAKPETNIISQRTETYY